MLLALLATSAQAQEYKHLGFMWSADQMPIVVQSSEYLEDSLPQTLDEKTGRYYQEDQIIKGFCNWHSSAYCDENLPDAWDRNEDAACADIRFEYSGMVAGNPPVDPNDGRRLFVWDDPGDIQGTGVLATTYCSSDSRSDVVKSVDGASIRQVYDGCDISYNNDVNWGTTEDIGNSCSNNDYCIEAVTTHEQGHFLGLAHTCEQDDICTDPEDQAATMFWSVGPCDCGGAEIGPRDEFNVTALYGPYVAVQEPSVSFGPAPLEVCFSFDAEEATIAELSTVEWSFGDGTTSDELAPCHTYETQGQFNVRLTVNGVSETCGEWDSVQIQRGAVTACEAPEPVFNVEGVDGLTYQMLNETDVRTYGCVDGVTWEIFKGGSTDGELVQVIGAWSPKVEFPSEGDYTVRLTTQGPGGEDAVQRTIEVVSVRAAGGGCASVPGIAGLAAVGGLLAAASRRRR